MPNRLAFESSPYLLQHKDNPVDWYPWGEEALARARAEDRPILLSIGYSACHWCHVMEHESFEDPETAALMNELFVSIKVDREERPDLDSIYMGAVQRLTGSGGWPMTVFLTPDGRPFYGGTYFPPVPRHGLPAFKDLLAAVADAYHKRRQDVEESASQIAESLNEQSTPDPEGEISAELLGIRGTCAQHILRSEGRRLWRCTQVSPAHGPGVPVACAPAWRCRDAADGGADPAQDGCRWHL